MAFKESDYEATIIIEQQHFVESPAAKELLKIDITGETDTQLAI